MTAAAVELRRDEPQVIVRPMLTTGRAIDLYLDDLERRSESDRTPKSYARILYKLSDRLPQDLDVSKVTTDDLRRFLATDFRGKAPGTVANAEAILSSFFKWLTLEEKIARNPVDRLVRTRRRKPEDLDVVAVSSDDVRLLLFHASTWSERLAIGVLAYLGPRRRAVAQLRLGDYDRGRRQLRFREKGGKTIWKPIPDELDRLIEAALAAGVYDDQAERYGTDYLVPPRPGAKTVRAKNRDDRIIYDIVKDVAARAGINSHVHALRAAFACYYLEANRGDLVGLQELMGHASLEVTRVYLRKLDKQSAMEPVRSLSWGVAPVGNATPSGIPQSASNMLAESSAVGAGGFEPPQAVSSGSMRDSANTDDDPQPDPWRDAG